MKFIFTFTGLCLVGSAVFFLNSCGTESVNAGIKDSPKTIGACDQNDVKVAINASNDKFPKQMDTCASPSWGNAQKTTACIKKIYPKLSEKCAACFGKVAECSAKNCKAKCMFGHFSEGCLSCVNSKCRDKNTKNSFSLLECTGLNPAKMPPSK